MSSKSLKQRVLITGAAGRLGRVLQAHFADSAGCYEFVLIDRDQVGPGSSIRVDLARFTPDWSDAFAKTDAVIHLAGNPGRQWTPWPQLAVDNIDVTVNVVRAMVRAGVKRLIFASTLQIMDGYRFDHGPIACDAPPRPISAYAETKLVCESLLRAFSDEFGLSVVCLRIGSVPGHGASPAANWTAWRLSKWLDPGDFCQAVELALCMPDVGFVALPIVSDNPGMRWDLSETRRVLGYAPSRAATPPSPTLFVKICSAIGKAHKRIFVRTWRHYLR